MKKRVNLTVLTPLQHISHLCSKPRCLEATHVALESPAVNNSRKNYGLVAVFLHCGKYVKT